MSLEVIDIRPNSTIEYSSKELLFLAKSGQPYRGSLYIKLRSTGKSFDTQSLKRYITSLRSQTFYAEDIAYEIYNKIEMAFDSEDLGVVVQLSARGGIAQRVSYGVDFDLHARANIFQV